MNTLGDRLVEGRDPGRVALSSARVGARAGESAVGQRLLAGFGQWHQSEAAEAQRAGLAVDDERCTQWRAPDGSTCKYNPLPSQYRPGRATLRQKAAVSALSGWRPFGFVFRGLPAWGSMSNFLWKELVFSGRRWMGSRRRCCNYHPTG